MRSRSVPLRLLLPIVVPLLLSPGCASRGRGPLPTLADYSDGTSAYVDALHKQWMSGRLSPDLFAAGLRWAGPLPGGRAGILKGVEEGYWLNRGRGKVEGVK